MAAASAYAIAVTSAGVVVVFDLTLFGAGFSVVAFADTLRPTGRHGHRQDLQIRRQLLRNRMKLEYFERFDIDRYLKQHPELDELYRWKERLHEFYRTKGIKKARQAYEKMIDAMTRSASEPVQKLLKTFKTWRSEILEYFENRLTNAFTEQTNNRGKLVQKRGYGYKSFRNYRLRMLSACLYSGCAL